MGIYSEIVIRFTLFSIFNCFYLILSFSLKYSDYLQITSFSYYKIKFWPGQKKTFAIILFCAILLPYFGSLIDEQKQQEKQGN